VVVDVLIAVFLLLSGTLAGVLFAVEIAIVPTVRALPVDRWVQVHRLLDERFDPLMPRINKVALAICAVLLVLANGLDSKVAFGVAWLCIIGVAVVSEAFNVRMNRDITTWNPAAPPPGWSGVRQRWAAANRIRTLIAALGFIGAVIGVALAWS